MALLEELIDSAKVANIKRLFCYGASVEDKTYLAAYCVEDIFCEISPSSY